MAGSANALQAAIFTALSEDAVLGGLIGPDAVFDRRMTGKPMPYVVIGEILTSDFGPETEEHRVVIEAWSDAAGRKQAQEIAARVQRLLDNAELALTGYALANLIHQSTRTARERKTRAFLAQMVFRAVTE